MANNENTREAARAALATYTDQPGVGGGDDRENITDLIADLMHLADQLGAVPGDEDPDLSGDTVMHGALVHYDGERSGDEFTERTERDASRRGAASDIKKGDRVTVFAHPLGGLAVLTLDGRDYTGQITEDPERLTYGGNKIIRLTIRQDDGTVYVRDAVDTAATTWHDQEPAVV